MKSKIRCDELPFPSWGGKREGAGRKRKSAESVPHARRPLLSRHHPVHVTWKLRRGLPRLRNRRTYAVLLAALRGGMERAVFRLNHYVVMSNHLHLIVEAEDRRSLSRGLHALAIRLARALNRLWLRRGRVFLERFHEHVLRTPTEVRRALVYVLDNARKHGAWLSGGGPDPFSSACDAVREGTASQAGSGDGQPFLPLPQTWLLRLGWLRGRAGRHG